MGDKEEEITLMKIAYTVGTGDGQYQKIQDAIDAAKNDSVIKISAGFYKENLVIRNKTLSFEAKDLKLESSKEKEAETGVFIMGENGPTITIENDLGEGYVVTLERLKLCHKGGSIKKNAEKAAEKKKDAKGVRKGVTRSMSIVEGKGGNTMKTTEDKEAKLSGVQNSIEDYIQVNMMLREFNSDTDCVVLVRRGSLVMNSVAINMNLIVRTKQPFVPAIVALNHSHIQISSCQFRGSAYFPSSGIIGKHSNINMKDTMVAFFSHGGVSLLVSEGNRFRITSCKISYNKMFGIQVIGRTTSFADFIKPKAKKDKQEGKKGETETELIDYNIIDRNEGSGIQIITPNSCMIRRNVVTFNQNGLEIISSDPKVMDNSFCRNSQNGIYIKSIEGLYSIPFISQNKVISNKENGILCTGLSNVAIIKQNQEISFNKIAGIKTENYAKPRIIMNNIVKNLMQGVLLAERTSAHIERNNISENIKANIAFGGEESSDTVIIKNKIMKGRCEGIFMIEGGTAIIKDNIIEQNYDGVILIASCPELVSNVIAKNKNSGIMVMKDSKPNVVENSIEENGSLGIFVRDTSVGQFKANRVLSHDIGLVVERMCSNGKEIKEQNTFSEKSDIRIPYTIKEMRCHLI